MFIRCNCAFEYIKTCKLKVNKTARITRQNPECSDIPLIHIETFFVTENIEKL